MKYKISDYPKLGELWKRTGLPAFKKFVDNELTVLFGYWCLDIIELDKWLHRQYGEYEDHGFSMEDIIRKHYGESACKLIEEML